MTDAVEQRNLDELLVTDATAYYASIGLELIDETIGPKPSPALISSVTVMGVRVPVELEENPLKNTFTIRDGQRRVAAARAAGHETIPAMIYPRNGLFTGPVVSLALNGLRSSNPVAELDAVIDLQTAGLGEAEIAQLARTPIQTVRKRIALGRMDYRLLDGFRTGKMTVTVAEEAARLDPERQAELVKRLQAKDRLTGEDVRAVRRDLEDQRLAEASDELFDTKPYESNWRVDAADYLAQAHRLAINTENNPDAAKFAKDLSRLMARWELT